MALADLTDRRAVLAAMAEYDALGADVFLAGHHFGRSRGYLLVHDGRTYDSKAIAGVAHGIQHPHLGTLPSAQFNGGAAGAAKRLRALGFVVESPPPRNPDWCTDELLLALDVYLRHAPRLPPPSHDDIVELSRVLRVRSGRTSAGDSFRNPNSVRLKLANFGAHDPTYVGGHATNGGEATRRVWDQWHERPDALRDVADAIRAAVAAGTAVAEPDEEDDAVPEGATLYRLHRTRERNPALRRKKIEQARRAAGHLACEACAVHLPDVYGAVAESVVDVHHVVPLAHGARRVRLADLAVLCPNCHRVIHRAPGMTPADLKRQIDARRGASAEGPLSVR